MRGLKPGDQISHLTLKEKRYIRGHGSKGKASWVCDCICGKEVIRREDILDPNKSMSCGCQHPSKNARGTESHSWKGCGELGGQFFGMIQHSAKRREIPFAITIEYAWDLFVKQSGKCALTGIPLTFVGQRDRRSKGLEQTASLDRIDASPLLGYIEGNLQWVHKDVNMMKKEYPLERFIEICRLVTEHADEVCYGKSTSQTALTVAA